MAGTVVTGAGKSFSDNPEDDSLTITVSATTSSQGASGPTSVVKAYRRFLAYHFAQDFLTPSDQWAFAFDTDELNDDDFAILQPGSRVDVTIQDYPQTVGYIDDVTMASARGSGSVVHVSGRDWLAPSIDSHINPQLKLSSSQTLDQTLQAVFTPFGVTVFATDNAANLNAIQGQKRGVKTSKKGKPLKSFVTHQLKPYPQEGAYGFASRITQRFGLWLWPAVDGETLIVGTPDYDQDPSYQLRHLLNPQEQDLNNIIESHVVRSRKDQPSVMYCYAVAGGAEFPKAQVRAGITNPMVLADNTAIFAAYPQVKFTAFGDAIPIAPFIDPNARPMYSADPESHTLEQIQAYARRQMSLLCRKAFTANYTIEGHTINGVPVAINTMVDVMDERNKVEQPLWIIGRRFSKAPGEGTRTQIECILPGALQF